MAESDRGAPVEQVSLTEQATQQSDGQQQSTPLKWTICSINQGFYVTTDLSREELDEVLRSEDKDKWDKYLCHDNIKRMKVISFSDCQLRKIPMSICQIPSLTRLYFGMNKLDSIPSEFAQLENLTNLNLSGNQFSRVPEAIGRLRNLKVLTMQRNKLTNEGLETLKQNIQLEELSLASNQLSKELPHSVCQLKSLTLLDLRNNRIDSLTEEIANLTELRVLNVRQNHLYSLPKSMWKLVHLKLACFAENMITSVKFGAFSKLPELKDLCLYSNRLENKQELEKFLELFKTKGKLLRLAENRASITRAITCDSPFEYYSHDVTFLHDGTEEVASWVQRAQRHLKIDNISSTMKTPHHKSVEILRDVRTCHVVIPVFTQRFHQMVDQDDPSGANLRDALDAFVNRGRLSNFLLVFYETCVLSNKWFGRQSITVPTNVESELDDGSNGYDDHLDKLCNLVREMKGDRVRLSSTCMPHP
ncbi:uncharacterized protein [Amphiura filiformis]|uniref:uncharacterized protein n=1 Tax=Amphiura filiformis TaxID=82378 RepID=UPI003B223197